MKQIKLVIIACFVGVSLCHSQNKTVLEAIDNHIWKPFTTAFETSDYNLFANLHTNDLVRVSGNGKNIQGKEPYIAGYKERWQNNSRNQTISFRFLERIHNDDLASERGIYKLTINPNTEQSQSYYGKFHVILKKVNGFWRIAVDYDSSEGNTINEDSYNNAFPMSDYSQY